jgi:hypothetical protein
MSNLYSIIIVHDQGGGLSNGRGGKRSVTGPATVPWQIVGVIPVG